MPSGCYATVPGSTQLSRESEPSRNYGLPSFRDLGVLVRLAAIGVAVFVVVAAFAFVAGWLSPSKLTQDKMMDAFAQANGVHSGFRRNHAKGVCVAGAFESNGQAARLSTASVFQPGRVPVVGRFALAGGQPAMADGPQAVRSMALSFRPPGGEEWRTGMNNIPVFVVKDAKGFYDQLLAAAPDPATGKPDPAKMAAFLAAHPETGRALAIIRQYPFSSGFANAAYNSLNAFRFVSTAGVATPVRWSMVPVAPFEAETAGQDAKSDKNYLFDALIAGVRQGPLEWHLIVTAGRPGDPTDDATIAWPNDREHIDAGTLTIDHVEAEAAGNCRDINFDPLVLPAGIQASDDPLLSARSAAYSESFTRRAGEAKTPSAVQIGGGEGS
ncbi:MAG: Catalase related subgroup [Rhodospirillales bacterium]|nr:Catalase related subgroup [Rhodospirillales bacterium]